MAKQSAASQSETSNPKHRGRWRRVATPLSIAIAGAFLSILIAQAIAGMARVNSSNRTTELPAGSVRLPGYLRPAWTEPTHVEVQDTGSFGVTRLEMQGSVPVDPRPETPGDPEERSDATLSVSRLSFGWPLRCMYHDAYGLGGQVPDAMAVLTGIVDRAGWSFGVIYPKWVSVDRTWGRRIPRAVLWGGLAANTAAYGSLLYIVIAGPGLVRRVRRRLRGQCEWCGYPAGVSSVCTECGATLRAIGHPPPA